MLQLLLYTMKLSQRILEMVAANFLFNYNVLVEFRIMDILENIMD